MTRRHVASCLCIAALATGCVSLKRVGWEMGIPYVAAEFQVDAVESRGGLFLEAHISAARFERRVLARSGDADCRDLLRVGERVTWTHRASLGPLEQGDQRCTIVGIGGLERWRSASARSVGQPLMTQEAVFREVHRDDRTLYAIGGFRTVWLFSSWFVTERPLLALMPLTEACVLAGQDDFATIEYRVAGSPALAILTARGPCPIEALADAPMELLAPAAP